jgi:hypothetical protein
MSYDALVWLLVGLGVGVAGSLMLLLGYTGMERARLGRRLRKARSAVAVAAEPAPVVRPPRSRLDMARPAAAKPAAEETKPVPVKPALVVVPATAPEPVAVAPVKEPAEAEVAPPAPGTVAKPVEAEIAPATFPPTPQPAAPAGPKPVQSVEALFAEAFANDKLPANEPDEKSR